MNINYEMVDLGLPSGLKWVKCNLGAEKETDYGLYFQWGSTKSYTTKEDNYKKKYTKYNPRFDKKVILDKYDDPISKYMGLAYRMPTKEDFQELLKYTTYKRIINYNSSGVNGVLFTSKVNGNTLFIPASGYYCNGSFYGAGSYGLVWSSSLCTSNPVSSYCLYFNSGGCVVDNFGHQCAFSVRGVSRISQ